MARLTGKSVIVTGSANGIGAAAARLFAENGALVTAADIDAEGGEAAAATLRAEGLEVQFLRTDTTREGDVIALIALAEANHGRLDGAFNNVGLSNLPLKLADTPLAEMQRIFDINVTGTFLCMKYEIQAMLRTGGGSIVNTSSVMSRIYDDNLAVYCATKHAINGLTQAGAAEYAAAGIRINAIAPAATRTPGYVAYVADNPGYADKIRTAYPMGRASEPVEQAEAALWLLSDHASYSTGTVMLVDGGYTLR